MAIFPLVMCAATCTCTPYKPGSFRYADASSARMWRDVFLRVQASFRARAVAYARRVCGDGDREAEERAERFDVEFRSRLETLVERCAEGGDVDVTSFCAAREEALRRNGLLDIFDDVKENENLRAMRYLRPMLRLVDAVEDERERWRAILRGVFAGNLFDLGSDVTVKRFEEEEEEKKKKKDDGDGAAEEEEKGIEEEEEDIRAAVDTFISVRDGLRPAPAYDNLETCVERFTSHVYRKVMVFVDNAGPDFVLGMLPLIRGLLASSNATRVVVACNELPSINDITTNEAACLLERIEDGVIRQALESRRLSVISTGNGLPVIDLSKVSEATCLEAAGTDLVILEGMGRAIETNLTAEFTCDSLKLAVIKHEEVARCLGANLYECICRFNLGNNARPSNPES